MKVTDDQLKAAQFAYKAGIAFTLRVLRKLQESPDFMLRFSLDSMIESLEKHYDDAETETTKWAEMLPEPTAGEDYDVDVATLEKMLDEDEDEDVD